MQAHIHPLSQADLLSAPAENSSLFVPTLTLILALAYFLYSHTTESISVRSNDSEARGVRIGEIDQLRIHPIKVNELVFGSLLLSPERQ